MIRAGYGADTIYTQWATEALTDWQWLAKKSGETLVEECGALFLGETGSPHLAATAATLTACGVTHERLDAAAVASRYPQLGVIGLGDAIYEARGGVIRARRAVAAAVATARPTASPIVRRVWCRRMNRRRAGGAARGRRAD